MRKCPSCSSVLVRKIVDTGTSLPVKKNPIEVDLCRVCGGIWFDKGEVENISYSKLPDLLQEGKAKVSHVAIDACPPTSAKLWQECPSCGSVLKPLRSQNLPRDVEASFCPSCRGTFFSPSDLLKYKKAQLSKRTYFKNFNIPLPSRSLLITGFILLLFLSPFAVGLFSKSLLDNRTRAARLISKPFITTLAANRVTLTFTTKKPAISKIEVEAPYIVQSRVLPISNTYTTLHQITLKDLRPTTEYLYKLIIYDKNYIKTTSEVFTFRTP